MPLNPTIQTVISGQLVDLPMRVPRNRKVEMHCRRMEALDRPWPAPFQFTREERLNAERAFLAPKPEPEPEPEPPSAPSPEPAITGLAKRIRKKASRSKK